MLPKRVPELRARAARVLTLSLRAPDGPALPCTVSLHQPLTDTRLGPTVPLCGPTPDCATCQAPPLPHDLGPAFECWADCR